MIVIYLEIIIRYTYYVASIKLGTVQYGYQSITSHQWLNEQKITLAQDMSL